MTPTLLSASSAAYRSSPATASDSSAASVDGLAISGTASEESSDDHRDDVAPNDFAVLLAAMVAPAVPAPLRPRIEPGDASNSAAPAAAAGNAGAGTSAGLAFPVPLMSAGLGTSGVDATALEVEAPSSASAPTPAPSIASASTGTAPGAAVSTPAHPLDVTQALAGADPTVGRTATTSTEGADAGRVDGLSESVRAFPRIERESPLPSFGLVALDRPASLGRGVTEPLVGVGGLPFAGVSPQTDDSLAPVGPGAGVAPQQAPTAQSVAAPSENGAVSAPAAVPADPREASPPAPVAAMEVPRIGDGAENSVARTAATAPPQSTDIAVTARASRDDPSAPEDAGADASAVGVSAGPGHASPADRPGSVEAPTPMVAEGVRPGDASQHIVRAAQRAQTADGPQHMRLEMHPDDLGAVAVEVTIEDGVVHVAMVAERGETKDLLRSSIAELRSSLVAAGFSAGRVDIQSGLSDGRFGQAADRHDAWSQSFDRPDSRRDQSGAFANMFDQTGGRGDQTRSPRLFSEAADRGDSGSSRRGVRNSDRIPPDAATTPNGLRRVRLDLQL